MRKPSRKTLKNKLDKIVSEIVRSRGYCVWCGNKNKELLQCCHIYSRSTLAVRWDLKNVLCMCAGCHFRAHKNPLEFTEFVKKFLGEVDYIELKKRANTIRTFADYELEELITRMEEIRG